MTGMYGDAHRLVAELEAFLAIAERNLVDLGDDRRHHVQIRRANLQSTVTRLQSELESARHALVQAGLDSEAQTIAVEDRKAQPV